MRRLLALALALSIAACALAQVKITRVTLNRDEPKTHKPAAVVTSIASTEQTFHVVMSFHPTGKPLRLTGTLIALEAAGVKDYKVASVDLDVSKEDTADFKFSLPRPWPVGKYKVEIRAEGKVIRNVPFSVKGA